MPPTTRQSAWDRVSPKDAPAPHQKAEMDRGPKENLPLILLVDKQGIGALGEQIASTLVQGSVVALEGDLGAGKTTLARAIIRALGIVEPVPSPTFLLVQRYETTRLPVWHFDFYRIERSQEVEELGLDEALADGALIVEWPERARGLLPQEGLTVNLEIAGENERRATLRGPDSIIKAIGKNWPHGR
jgi:tRNA threonylcarbamoyl adenosine modification protein YjeE